MQWASISSFIKLGYEYHLYSYDKPKVPKHTILKDASSIIPRSNIFTYTKAAGPGNGSVSVFSNIFRYKLLLENGGCWADTDLIILKGLDLINKYFLVKEDTKNGEQYASFFLKTMRQSPFIHECYERSITIDKNTLEWGVIGPKLIGSMAIKYDLEKYSNQPKLLCPIPWWEFDKFVGPTPIDKTASGYHLWNEMWRRNSIDVNAPTKNSLYEQLIDKVLT